MRDVSVRISAALAAPPAYARDAWLSYTWAKGGGLPIAVLPVVTTIVHVKKHRLAQQVSQATRKQAPKRFRLRVRKTVAQIDSLIHCSSVSQPHPTIASLL